MSRPIPPSYKTKNWPAYNEALKQRGSLTIWFDPDMAWVPPPTGKRGRQPQYSDAAIQTCLTMKVLFGMALRQTTGFVESLLRLVGLDLDGAGLNCVKFHLANFLYLIRFGSTASGPSLRFLSSS